MYNCTCYYNCYQFYFTHSLCPMSVVIFSTQALAIRFLLADYVGSTAGHSASLVTCTTRTVTVLDPIPLNACVSVERMHPQHFSFNAQIFPHTLNVEIVLLQPLLLILISFFRLSIFYVFVFLITHIFV